MLQHIVVCVAHPDDETILAGGTLALLARQQIRVHVLCATRGEGGELGEPPVTTRANIGPMREAEMRCACEALGVGDVHFLGYVDPTIDEEKGVQAFRAPYAQLVNQIYAVIKSADMVLSHGKGGEYGHPAHQLMYQAVWDAVERLDRRMLFYSVAAALPGQVDILTKENEPAHLALDIRPWLDVKERAALCHRSQHALFMRRQKLQQVRDALRTVESFRRELPVLEGGHPDDAFAELLQSAGGWAL